MLRFLVDESSGGKLAEALKEKGYDTIYCGDYSPGSPDEGILKKARNEDRVIITNDKDFGEMVFRQRKLSCGVIFLRLKADKPSNRIKFSLAIIKEFGTKLNKKFIVVSEGRIRIRKI